MKSTTAMTKELVLVDVQNALTEYSNYIPSDELLSSWVNLAYKTVAASPTEVTVRLVDEDEMAELNQAYRGKPGTTNVLSFVFENEFGVDAETPSELEPESIQAESIPDLLGDIVICHNVVVKEALEQNKTEHNHYAHMVAHGVLHLCGYDHMNDEEAEEMEALEVKILAQSHIENPYT
jgi:probable rRNA maturation factor